VTDVPDDLVAAVHARTGGNPFFVREVARLIDSQGQSRSVAVPAHVREMLERRLARLSRSAHRALAVAAVCADSGEYINMPLITAVAGGTTAAVLGRIEEAVRARLVAVEPGSRLRFAHTLVREVLEDSLSVHDSADTHAAVAQWLENAGADEDLAGEIARHWSHAIRPDAAVRSARWSLVAARAAAGRLGFEQAVGAYRRALAAPDADGVALRLELGEAQRLAGDPVGARRTLLDAAARARAAGRAEDLARAGLGLGGGLAGFEVRLRDETAVALLTEALDVLPHDDSALRAAVLARLSLALTGLDTDQRRFELAAQAVATPFCCSSACMT
jgi:tetratricopeptide (TPR) repeat protein